MLLDKKIKDVLVYDIESQEFDTVIKVEEEITPKFVDSLVKTYVVTDRIAGNLEKFLENINNYYTKRGESYKGIWLSGYYGSGKSHFANVVRFLIEDRRMLDGTPVREFFVEKKLSGLHVGESIRLLLKSFSQRKILVVAVSGASIGKIDLFKFLAKRTIKEVRKDLYESWGISEADYINAYALEILGHIDDEAVERIKSLNGRPILFAFNKDVVNEVKEKVNEQWFADTEVFVKEFLLSLVRDEGYDGILFIMDELEKYLTGRSVGETTDRARILQGFMEATEVGHRPIWFAGIAQHTFKELIGDKDLSHGIKSRFKLSLHFETSDVREVVIKRFLKKKKKEGAAEPGTLWTLIEENIANIRSGYLFINRIGGAGRLEKVNVFDEYPFQLRFVDLISDILYAYMEEIRDKGSVRNTLGTIVNLMKRYVSKRHVPQLIPLSELPNVVEDFYIEEKVHRVRKQVREVLGEEEEKLFSLLFLIQFSPYDGLVMRRKWGDGMSLTEIAQLTYDDITKNFSKHQTYIEGLLERLVKEGFVTQSVKGLYKALSDTEWEVEREVRNIRIDASEILKEKKNFLKKLIGNKIKSIRESTHEASVVYISGSGEEIIIESSNPTIVAKIVPARECAKNANTDKDQDVIVCVEGLEDVDELIKNYLQFKRYAEEVRNYGEEDEKYRHAVRQRDDLRHRVENKLKYIFSDAPVYHRNEKDYIGKINGENIAKSLEDVIFKAFKSLYGDHKDDKPYSFTDGYRRLDKRGFANVLERISGDIVNFDEKLVEDIVNKYTDRPYGFHEDAILAAVAYLHSQKKIDLFRPGSDRAISPKEGENMGKNEFKRLRIVIVEDEPTEEDLKKVEEVFQAMYGSNYRFDVNEVPWVIKATFSNIRKLLNFQPDDPELKAYFEEMRELSKLAEQGLNGVYKVIKRIAANRMAYKEVFRKANPEAVEALEEKEREIRRLMDEIESWKELIKERVKGTDLEYDLDGVIEIINTNLEERNGDAVKREKNSFERKYRDYIKRHIEKMKTTIEKIEKILNEFRNDQLRKQYMNQLDDIKRRIYIDIENVHLTKVPKWRDIDNLEARLRVLLQNVRKDKDVEPQEPVTVDETEIVTMMLPKGPIDVEELKEIVQRRISELERKKEVGKKIQVIVEVERSDLV